MKTKFLLLIALTGVVLNRPTSVEAETLRKVEGHNISFEVPGNLPAEEWAGDERNGSVVFKHVTEHERLMEFSKVVYSEEEVDFKDEAPFGEYSDGDYEYKDEKILKDPFLVNNHKGKLGTVSLDIVRRCGSVDKTGLLLCKLYCDVAKRHFAIFSLSLSENEFIQMLDSFKCHSDTEAQGVIKEVETQQSETEEVKVIEAYDMYIRVPKDFPSPLWTEKDGRNLTIFKEEAEDGSIKQFFEAISSLKEIDYKDVVPRGELPDGIYKYGKEERLREEGFRIHTHQAKFSAVDLDIKRKDGSIDKKRVFMCKLYCDRSERYFMVLGFTIEEDEFRKIMNSFRCH
ncbi:MAG: hypothetical protein ISS34_08185 [Candidatus Omnitrophica bacterium]|nr:hypothetical protein [Candidatus Omnitrophota bacterium]